MFSAGETGAGNEHGGLGLLGNAEHQYGGRTLLQANPGPLVCPGTSPWTRPPAPVSLGKHPEQSDKKVENKGTLFYKRFDVTHICTHVYSCVFFGCTYRTAAKYSNKLVF